MNQQIQGLGSPTPSNVPNKRKRGRPRKEQTGAQGNNMPEMAGSANVLNSSQTARTTDNYDEMMRQMMGKAVPAVIEGTFDGGCLVKVQVEDIHLRGAVFLPGRVVPVTAENDVAPHVSFIERKDMPIPVPNPKTRVRNSASSSRKRKKQPSKPEVQAPMPISQILPSELHSDISVSLENQFASFVPPMADLPKMDSFISTGRHANEFTADGGATKDPEKTYQVMNVVPTVENTEELRTGQQSVPSVHQVIEFVTDDQLLIYREDDKDGEVGNGGHLI